MVHLLPSQSSGAVTPDVIILGPQTSFRVKAFQAALAASHAPAARVIGYHQFLENPDLLRAALSPGSILRFETPDQDPAELTALLARGVDACRKAGYRTLDVDDVTHTICDAGRLSPPAQLYFGLADALSRAAHIAEQKNATMTAAPTDILTAMDKTNCAAHLERCNVPIPRYLGAPANFDELMALMKRHPCRRVFIKLRHGSSAAGMMALATASTGEMIATTTAAINARGHLCATRRIQQLRDVGQIAHLVNQLAPLGLHVEQWVNKAGFQDTNCDLRVITIAHEPVFTILRQSRHPMTNLHLGGMRQDAEHLLNRMDDDSRAALFATCRTVAAAFPSCAMLGIDIAVLSDFNRHVVLEVNGFGDFVKDVTHQGLTPHEWQIQHLYTHLNTISARECHVH